ncbi:MAG: tartrate-resistant acid phosphatase type 5 [bacterium]|jgi:tartrate-resistant acid phosphatase type 5
MQVKTYNDYKFIGGSLIVNINMLFRKWIFFVLIFTGLFSLGAWGGYRFNNVLQRKGCINLKSDIIKIEPKLKNKDVIQFVVLGDTGTGSRYQREVANGMKKVCAEKGCDFFIIVGDNFYPSGVVSVNDPRFEYSFEKMYAPLKPFYTVLGNHDVRRGSNALSQVMYSLKNSRWKMPNFNYQFEVAGTRFIAPNTECSLLGWRYLDKQLEKNKKPANWTFVYTHHPIYSTGTHGDIDFTSRWIWSSLQKKVDFYISGHDHQLEHLTKKGHNTQYIVSGAGGKSYRNVKLSNLKKSKAKSNFTYRKTGFVRFTVTKKRVDADFYSATGKKVYSFTRTK